MRPDSRPDSAAEVRRELDRRLAEIAQDVSSTESQAFLAILAENLATVRRLEVGPTDEPEFLRDRSRA